MSDLRAPLAHLDTFTEQKRQASLTGSLIGLDLPGRDRLLAEIVPRFERQLAQAREQAAARGEPVAIDGAAISLTDGGDTWLIDPDGRMDRRYETHPGFVDFLAQIATRPAVDFSRPATPDQLLASAYEAFWSPSATNWQPTRVLELRGEAARALAAIAGWPAPADDFPLLALLRRDHYESLLGDVLEPFGLEVTAREESIDAGIFAQTLVMAALAQGLTVQEHVLAPAEVPAATGILASEIGRRLALLTGQSDALLAREREALETLAAMLADGRYIPDAFAAVGQPAGEVRPFAPFPRIVAEHSTQRVASPAGEFGHEAVLALWDQTRGTLAPAHRDVVRFADFSWHDQVPSRIGKAMFESLYGVGADPETKTGGAGGILTAVTVKNWLLHMASVEPEHVDAHMPEGWRALDELEARRAAKGMPVRARDLGRFMRERLTRDGKWVIIDGWLQDAEGRPLTVPLLVRLMKSLAATFGNFFLKFQNTHPQNAVLLVDTGAENLHLAYRVVGQAAAVLTFLSRAEGASSIIKTGPIDLARDPIASVLAENPDDLPHLRPWREGLESGRWKPAMTFQVGLPLKGSDVVDAGTPGEHSGYEERKRDKRPPREDFTCHYFPAL